MSRKRFASSAILVALAAVAGCSYLPQQEIVTQIVSSEPPEKLWSVLVDRERYPAWNPLIVRSEGPLIEGEHIRNTMTPAEAFALRTLLVHEFRRLRLRDPELPSELLPSPWAGDEAFDLAAAAYAAVDDAAWRWAEHHLEVAEATDAPPAPSWFAS